MKPYSSFAIFFFVTIFTGISCKKDEVPTSPNSGRTIQFNLYTVEDFSNDDHNITFSLFIKTHTQKLFDSTLATMKIKDIPNEINKLIVLKKVPHDDGSDLSAGFVYTIENVGVSWHIDTISGGEPFKIIDFSFK